MSLEDDRRGEDRRSPVGDFLLGALALRGDEPLAYGELLQIAGDSGLSMSSVLAWVGRAEDSGLVEQVSGPNEQGRALRLTPAGIERARNSRRRAQRRSQWKPPTDEFP